MKKSSYLVIILIVGLLVCASHIYACSEGDSCPICVQAPVWTPAVVLTTTIGIADAGMMIVRAAPERPVRFDARFLPLRAPPRTCQL